MSFTRFARGALGVPSSDPRARATLRAGSRVLLAAQLADPAAKRRRRGSSARALAPRRRSPALRRRLGVGPRVSAPYEPRLAKVHDFGDGRHALEFDAPSMDLVLYHDGGRTIAEWVTVAGDLLWLVRVGAC